MAYRKQHTTTRLPQSLVDEINAQSETGTSSTGHKRTSGFSSRRAERKAERQLAKQRKAQFFSHGTGKSSNKRGVTDDSKENNLPRKRVKTDPTSDIRRAGTQKASESKDRRPARDKQESVDVKGIERKAKSTSSTKSKDGAVKLPQKRSRVEEEEDAYISLLERKLGIEKDKKGKDRYGSGFEDDGLLDLLTDLDEKVLVQTNESLNEALDNDEDFDTAESSERDENELPDRDGSSVDEERDTWTGFVSGDVSEGEEEENENGLEKPASGEVEGQSPGAKYVPPHLRKQQQDPSEVDMKLVRQLKGLLNRLSEQNIDSILKEIENLYRSHRRHDMTATLTDLIIEGTCSHSVLLDSYVALHAGLVACLHKIVGVELAAYFVQNVVTNFEGHYRKSKGAPIETNAEAGAKREDIGKECSNLLVLLSDLYNHHVISCTLIYDIIRLILEGDLSELDVELVLKLARASGAQLRQDDPTALKDIVQIVQSKLGDQRNTSSRTRFMVEILINLKNNKLKKTTGGAQGGNESKERISKFVAGMGKKYHVHAHEPLRISLEDLHQADSKGKWWLVGAAWGGDPLAEQQPSLAQSSAPSAENALLNLARRQGMNTDVRRSVFVVLMSSDDYVDACDRMAQLNLTEVQQREIIRVLLHCCGNEKSYNPYYTLVTSHLCRQSHSHKVTLQYCFWDFLRSLGETHVGSMEMAKGLEDEREGEEGEGFELDRISSTRMANVARFYAWLVAKDCVTIIILKTVDFIALKTKTKTFLKLFFTHLFANTQDPSSVPSLSSTFDTSVFTRRDEKALIEVLVKAARVPSLPLGILHFLSTTFPKADTPDPMDEFMQWCCCIARDVFQDVDTNPL